MKNAKRWIASQSAPRLFLLLSCSIFFSEMLIMLFLGTLPPLSIWAKALMDSSLLLIVIFPILYVFVYRPLLIDVTERKRADEALRKSEEWFRTLFEKAIDGIIYLSFDGELVSVNESFATMHGYTIEEIEKMSLKDLDTPECSQLVPERMRRVLAGEKLTFEVEHYHKDGHKFPLEVTASMITVGDKKFALAFHRNITERKRSEELLKQSQERFSVYMENTPAVAWFKDAEGRMLYVNPPYEHAFRIKLHEVYGKNDYELWPEPVARQLREHDLHVLKTNQLLETNEDVPTDDGVMHHWQVFKFPLPDRDGKTLVGGMGLDITERKRTEEGLIKLRKAINTSKETIFLTDTEGIFTFVNPGFTDLYGYTADEVVGKATPRILKSGLMKQQEYETFWKTLLNKQEIRRDLVNKTKDGRLINIEASASPILDEKMNIIGFLGIQRDITERRNAEEKRKILETQLQQAQKLESLGTLASGIAHDFNNILAIIMGYSSLLMRIKVDPEKVSQSLEAIMKATHRGASLVKQLLTFARKTEVLFESVRVNDSINEIISLLQETFPKTITVSTFLQPELPSIIADVTHIHQVLLNLCVNARDAMPQGGTLSISTSTIEGESVSSRFPKATARRYVRIELSDTGAGMDEATRRRIFEPFFTTKGAGKGTGLGLALVFGIVENHGGFIDVQSTLGEGTTFTLYLPIHERKPEVSPPTDQAVEDIRGGTETILVIEDEEMLRELVKAVLVSKGYTVLTAEDGLQGLEVFARHQKEIALVLSDMGLPVLSGEEVFKKIRTIDPQAKIIFASGFIDPDMKAKMRKAGAQHFIHKPYSHNEVLQKIREVIDATH